jgi:hypothetical protein
MAKRKKTDVVKLQLRIREALRRRLEATASAEERSLNSEIAHRLESSFQQDRNSLLIELLAPGADLELLRHLAIILRRTGHDWNTPSKSHAVSEAISKLIAVLSGELEPIENSFPKRGEKGSADELVWTAISVRRWESISDEISGRPWQVTVRGKPAGKMS